MEPEFTIRTIRNLKFHVSKIGAQNFKDPKNRKSSPDSQWAFSDYVKYEVRAAVEMYIHNAKTKSAKQQGAVNLDKAKCTCHTSIFTTKSVLFQSRGECFTPSFPPFSQNAPQMAAPQQNSFFPNNEVSSMHCCSWTRYQLQPY